MVIKELDPNVFQYEEESFEDYSEEFVTYAVDIYQDFNKVAENFIYGFFCNKSMCCGGPIPKTLLFSPDYVSLVLNTKTAKGIEKAHKMIEAHNSLTDDPMSELEAIRLVQESLDLFSHSGVPKQFSGGILLMYLELVEGITIFEEILEEEGYEEEVFKS